MADQHLPPGTTYRHLDIQFDGPECWCDELQRVRRAEMVRDGITDDVVDATLEAERQDFDTKVVCSECRRRDDDAAARDAEADRAVDAWLEERYEREWDE